MNTSEKFYPVVLFVYNRPEHTKKTINSLLANKGIEQTDLFIFSDAAKNEIDRVKVQQVRSYVASISGVKTLKIYEQTDNLGLANSIITGVSKIIKEFGAVIVLEDDLVLSNYFLRYMNRCLTVFEKRDDIFSISGYSSLNEKPENYQSDIYLSPRSSSWGWGTWKDRWSSIRWEEWQKYPLGIPFSFNYTKLSKAGDDIPLMLLRYQKGKINSWAIRFLCHALLSNKLHVMPVNSKVQNIGHDLSGTHSPKTTKYDVVLDQYDSTHIDNTAQIDERWVNKNLKFFKKSFVKILYHYIRNKFL